MSMLEELVEEIKNVQTELAEARKQKGYSINNPGVIALNQRLAALVAERTSRRAYLSGASPNVNSDLVLLWRAIMEEDALQVTGDRWVLSNAYWCESTQSLMIRDWWKSLRGKILDGSFYSSYHDRVQAIRPGLVPPHMVVLDGKAGRGKSAFLRYLIFFILREAMASNESSSSAGEQAQEYLTNPRIAFVDRDQRAYLITTKAILPLTTQRQLMDHRPHYFFADNVDIDNESSGSRVVMGLTSGDTNVLKKYRKRWAEARKKPRSHLFMRSPDLVEMIAMFSDMATNEDITFRFDVVGGNPRLAFDQPAADSNASYYSLVEQVVHIMFPLPAAVNREAWARLQRWAVDTTSGAFDHAIKNHSDAALDSSTFREYIVDESGEKKVKEDFSSAFMGMVAARVKESPEAAVFSCSLWRLFGSADMGVYFAYGAQWAFLNARPDTVYECIPSNGSKTPVKMQLGGGQVKLIRTVTDLEHLQEGDHAISTLPNDTIVDSVVYLHGKKIGLQMTSGLHHDGAVTKLGQVRQALGIHEGQPFVVVFVVPVDRLEGFIFPANLVNTSMYLTTYTPCAPDVMEPGAKKRRTA